LVDEDAWSDVTTFATRFIVEIARSNASQLITYEVMSEYLRNLGLERWASDDARNMTAVLKLIVGAGLSLANHKQVAAQLDATNRPWLSPLARAELMVEIMHPTEAQVRGQPAAIAQIAGIDLETNRPVGEVGAIKAELEVMSAASYKDMGVRMPLTELVPDMTVNPGQIAIRVAHQSSVGYVIPPAGTVMVRETPEKLVAQFGVKATGGLCPGTAEPVAFVPEFEAARLRNSGVVVETQAQWLMLAIQSEVLGRPLAILQLRHVLVELGAILDSFPALIQTVLSLCAPSEITIALRDLIREGVSIRDLRAILENLAIAVVKSSQLGVTANLRLGIKERLVFQAGHKTGRLFYFRLEPNLATLALSAWLKLSAGQVDAEVERSVLVVRDAVWTGVRAFHPAAPPTIVTRDDVRLAVRSLIEPEMPSVPVLSESEIADFKEAIEVAVLTLRSPVEEVRTELGELDKAPVEATVTQNTPASPL